MAIGFTLPSLCVCVWRMDTAVVSDCTAKPRFRGKGCFLSTWINLVKARDSNPEWSSQEEHLQVVKSKREKVIKFAI